MKSTLVLTGWGLPDYAAAAAAALRACNGADLLGVSKRRLPEILAKEGKGREAVFVLGVSVRDSADEIAKVVRRLAESGTSVTWISSQDLPDEAKSLRHCDELTLHVDTSVRTLTAVVGKFFNVDVDDLVSYAVKTTKRETAIERYQELFQAAGYAHRNRDDDRIYVLAIQSLSRSIRPEAWDSRLVAAVADFRKYGYRELLGCSKAIERIRGEIALVAKHDRVRVMILGGSGTGKETVAQQIHSRSSRKGEKFQAFNCASVTPDLLEAHLFGYEKGAFTGADKRTEGIFEVAKGGTLFLDEIGELPLEAQALLLRVLQENKYQRLGGTEDVDADVRLITATNNDLAKKVKEKTFRLDLFQRLCTVQIRIPPLNERKEDIRQIAEDWWIRNKGERLTEQQIADLTEFDYVGNVRELVNLLERALVLEESDFKKVISDYKEINAGLFETEEDRCSEYPENLDEMTRLHVRTVMGRYKTQKDAAKALGVAVNTMKKYLC